MARTATSWELESVFQQTVRLPLPFSDRELVDINVRAEVPMCDGQRVQRKGNRYHQTWVNVDVTSGRETIELLLDAQTAREVGVALIAAADAADVIDKPDQAPCGHWSPCNCGQGTD